MKLITFSVEEKPVLGAIAKGRAIDLPRAVAAFFEAVHDTRQPAFPTTMRALLEAGDTAMQVAAKTLNWLEVQGIEALAPVSHPLEAVSLAPPVPDPSKIVCCGLNYADHCREQNIDLPKNLVLFSKFSTALIGYGDAITWKAGTSQQVDYEAELAVVIGRRARRVSEAEAMGCVAGYTVLNDVSGRRTQRAEKQWLRAKGFDGFGPCGPWIVTTDEIPDPHALTIECRVNGELRQSSDTGRMIFRIPYLVSYLSRTMTLEPGDIISTGTPGGVGEHRDPPVFLADGDAVTCTIQGIGTLENPVRAGL